MKTFIILIGIIIAGITVYYLLFPKNVAIFVPFLNNGNLIISKTGISYKKAPDSISKKGLDGIAPYISKLNKPSSNYKSIIILLPEKEEGILLSSRNGQLKVSLSATLTKQPGKESLIREYFTKIRIEPERDYLAQDDTIRILDYNLSGSDHQLTELMKDILTTIFGYKSGEELNISYDET